MMNYFDDRIDSKERNVEVINRDAFLTEDVLMLDEGRINDLIMVWSGHSKFSWI